jgi:hypothetical protein
MSVLSGAVHKAARETIRKVRSIRNSGLERKAHALANALTGSRLQVNDDLGYVNFNVSDLGLEKKISRLATLAHEWKSDPMRANDDKPFLIRMLRSDDLFEIPEILDVTMHDEVLSCVSRYFGQVPWVASINVWWTQPNQTAVRSQLYHYDHRDTRQAKLFINLVDVTPDSGPLHFLPASHSVKVDSTIGYSQGRYTDEEVYSACSVDNVISTIGPSGSAFIVDTARCLHYGSRGNLKERLVLMISFSRINCVDRGEGCDVLDPVRDRLIRQRYNNDVVRSFCLQAQ